MDSVKSRFSKLNKNGNSKLDELREALVTTAKFFLIINVFTGNINNMLKVASDFLPQGYRKI